MIHFLQRNKPNYRLVIRLSATQATLSLWSHAIECYQLAATETLNYQSIDQLSSLVETVIKNQWNEHPLSKKLPCYWLLERDLCQSTNMERPDIPSEELKAGLAWLVKDHFDIPTEQIETSFTPLVTTEAYNQHIVAFGCPQSLIYAIQAVTTALELELLQILPTESVSSATIGEHCDNGEITALIEEDSEGLVFSFFHKGQLAFSRHAKNKQFPQLIFQQQNQEFSLEEEQLESSSQNSLDKFLLETQRTLDYCTNQIFRRPINQIIINPNYCHSDSDNNSYSNRTSDHRDRFLLNQLTQTLEIKTNLLTNLLSKHFNTAPDQQNQSPIETPLTYNLSTAEWCFTNINLPDSFSDSNLYGERFKSKPLEFGLNFAVSVVAISVISFIAIGFAKTTQYKQLRAQQAQQSSQLENLKLSLESIRSRQKNTPTIDIQQQINNKQKSIASGRQLLDKVEQSKPTEAIRYSSVFETLTKKKQANLWLTEINLDNQFVTLNGQTTKSGSITQYIKAISEGQQLASQFKSVLMERNSVDYRVLDFELNQGTILHVD